MGLCVRSHQNSVTFQPSKLSYVQLLHVNFTDFYFCCFFLEVYLFKLFVSRFDPILHTLETSISGGRAAVEYIKKVHPSTYARHAFPLPRMSKVCSNPVEQANSGLLAIREFASLKLLVELWYYIQGKYNERRVEAQAREELLTPQHTVAIWRTCQALDSGRFRMTVAPKLRCGRLTKGMSTW